MFTQALGSTTLAAKATGLSKKLDFTSDGLHLDPSGHAALLHEVTSTQAFESDYYSNGGIIAELE